MIKGLTSSLWPIHTKPLPDELLSCWLIRLAHGHGLKVQTFCNLVFGNKRQVWNRDIDRLAPEWLIDELVARTGTAHEVAYNTTLRPYEGWLFAKFRESGSLSWILTLKMYHRKRQGFGLQFCPLCLREDETPYFRRQWRVVLNVMCAQHNIWMQDRCPKCRSGVAFHRIEMGRPNSTAVDSLSVCHDCGFDLRDSPTQNYDEAESEEHAYIANLCRDANRLPAPVEHGPASADSLAVMRQFCKLVGSERPKVRLREFIDEARGGEPTRFVASREPIETRPPEERIEMLFQAGWMMADLEGRVGRAWTARAIRYNHLLKEFTNPPDWFVALAERFSNWRDRRKSNDPPDIQ
jgi:hypothetical protein